MRDRNGCRSNCVSTSSQTNIANEVPLDIDHVSLEFSDLIVRSNT